MLGLVVVLRVEGDSGILEVRFSFWLFLSFFWCLRRVSVVACAIVLPPTQRPFHPPTKPKPPTPLLFSPKMLPKIDSTQTLIAQRPRSRHIASPSLGNLRVNRSLLPLTTHIPTVSDSQGSEGPSPTTATGLPLSLRINSTPPPSSVTISVL